MGHTHTKYVVCLEDSIKLHKVLFCENHVLYVSLECHLLRDAKDSNQVSVF